MYNSNDYMGQDLESNKKVTAKGILLAVLFGVLATAAGGLVYALLDNYVPFIYVNAIFAYLFGFIIAKAVSFGAKIGHITNKGVVYSIGGILILVAEYFNWVFWIYVYSEFDMLVFKLGDMFDIIRYVNIVGAWEIKGSAVTGTMLWIVWACEAIVIGVGLIATLKKFYESNAYCSRCNSWVSNIALSVEVEEHGDKKYIKQALLNNDFSIIDSMEPIIDDYIKSHWRLDLKVCDDCNSTYFLNVVDAIIKKGARGKTEVNESFIVNNVPVDSSVYEKIEALIRNSKNVDKSNVTDIVNEESRDTIVEVDDINRYID